MAEVNNVNQQVIARQVQPLGRTADIVATSSEVLYCLKRISHNIVVMDCQMPGRDRCETTGLIRQRESNAKYPVIIAVAAQARHGDQDKCLQAGMDDYISKPFTLEDLQRLLKRWRPVAMPMRVLFPPDAEPPVATLLLVQPSNALQQVSCAMPDGQYHI